MGIRWYVDLLDRDIGLRMRKNVWSMVIWRITVPVAGKRSIKQIFNHCQLHGSQLAVKCLRD